MESVQFECRYCFSEEDINDMIAPCNCEGSIKYVHTKCLKKWITNRGSVEVYEGGNYFYQLSCEVCKFKIRFLKEYENGLVISFMKTLLAIFLDLKNLSIFLVQFVLIYYFLQRMQNVLDYGNYTDLTQKHFLNVFHEFIIFMSLIFGINDIFRYYNTIFTENRRIALRFSTSSRRR